MRRSLLLVSLTLTAALLASVAMADRRLPVERSQSFECEVSFGAADSRRLLIVDNICGSVVIHGHERPTVLVRVAETIRARTEADADRAAAEAELTIDARSDQVSVIADGPFRGADGRIVWRQRRYSVCYDLEITAPSRLDLDVRTINEGRVEVSGIAGDLVASNVNGPVTLDRVAGSGSLSSVNGDVELRVDKLPNGGWSIDTVNGDIEAWFPPRLAADLKFTTRHGIMLTDFEHELREAESTTVSRDKDGVFRLERPRAAWSRVGGGGAEISIETLNGDIRLRRATGGSR